MASGAADQKDVPIQMAPPTYDASMQQGVAMPMAPGPVTSPMPMAHAPVATQQQVVVTQQPSAVTTTTAVGPFKRDWNSNMCGCCMDPVSCCCAFCCGPFYLCHTLTRMNENCCVGWLPCFALPAMRSNFRGEHGIYGDLCNDVCTSAFCSCCVLAQLSREIDYVNQQPSTIIFRQ
ncbi:PREDICTED: placenta-specific gene 8 protein-like [Branchiostoma belcheri]|uniref:Placenta-specific gene 8 protein-like n=1 Tax=Branchiostoma belcheri TaxID=7741 RepID=A0A6P4Z6K1_BRABE|nr:PREDICTED: placenta-specific gene 8 protein-like [Branchiostoma belcheri]